MRALAVVIVLLAGCDLVLGLETRSAPIVDAQLPLDAALGPWRAAQPLTSVNTGADGDASLTADGLELMFSSNRTAQLDGYDIYLARRATTAPVRRAAHGRRAVESRE